MNDHIFSTIPFHKRLDRFLVSGDLIDRVGRYRSWTSQELTSDHLPVNLQVDFQYNRVHYPFKFNKIWIRDGDFKKAVEHYWIRLTPVKTNTNMGTFLHKLTLLKKFVVNWVRKKVKEQSLELSLVENEIADLLEVEHTITFNSVEKDRLLLLQHRKDQLLLLQEITWRLKSRALWIEVGDKNTKYFHAYANQRRNINSIWNIQNDEGLTVTSQSEIESAAFKHFKDFYQDTPSDISTQVEVARLLPRYFSEAEARQLELPVTSAEIKDVLTHLAADKSPGPDGWPAEFILAFYELLGNDLFMMVEESRIRGTVTGSLNATIFRPNNILL